VFLTNDELSLRPTRLLSIIALHPCPEICQIETEGPIREMAPFTHNLLSFNHVVG